jgi:hypothetical protein
LLRFFPPRIGFSGIKKETPHRRIAETTIALDASLHSTANLSTGKLSPGKRAFVKVHEFPDGLWLDEPIAPNPWAIAYPYFLAS